MSLSTRSAATPAGRVRFAAPKSSASASNPFGSGGSFAWHSISPTASAYSSSNGAFDMLQGGEQSGYGRVGGTALAPGNSSNPFSVKPFGASRQVPAVYPNEPHNYPGVAPGVFGSESFTNGDAGQSAGGWYRNPQCGATNSFQANAFRGRDVSALNPFAKVVAAAAPTANPFRPTTVSGAESRLHPKTSPFAPQTNVVNPFTAVVNVDSQKSPFGKPPSASPSVGRWQPAGSFSNPFGSDRVSNNAFAVRKSESAGVSFSHPQHHNGRNDGHDAFPNPVAVSGGTWRFHPHSEPQANVTGTTSSAFKGAGGVASFSNNVGASHPQFQFSTPAAATLKFNFAPKVENGFAAPQQLGAPLQPFPKAVNAGCVFLKSQPIDAGSNTADTTSSGFSFDGCGPRSTMSLEPRIDATIPTHANFDAGSAPTSSTQLTPSPQQGNLIALPDVDPYGTGTYGAGRVEIAVRAALGVDPSPTADAFSSPKANGKASATRPNLGLPNHPICTHFKLNRRAVDPRNSLRVAAIRNVVHFKGSACSQATPKSTSLGARRSAKAQVDFRFKSSLFRDLSSKKELVLRSNASTSAANGERLRAVDSPSLPPIPETREATAHASKTRRPVSSRCPTLSNPQLSTIPEYSQLRQMTSEDLAQVHGFAIRSAEYGVIEWPGVTDVRGLNLDEIVRFSEDEVVVYPDAYHGKPAVGMGLNKRAVLQLAHIYPLQPASSEEEVAAFAERLEARTQRFGGDFLGYAPSGGVWKFQVAHF